MFTNSKNAKDFDEKSMKISRVCIDDDEDCVDSIGTFTDCQRDIHVFSHPRKYDLSVQ